MLKCFFSLSLYLTETKTCQETSLPIQVKKVCSVVEINLLSVVAYDQRSTVPWPQLLPDTKAGCDSLIHTEGISTHNENTSLNNFLLVTRR
jgi:hypothetical protein